MGDEPREKEQEAEAQVPSEPQVEADGDVGDETEPVAGVAGEGEPSGAVALNLPELGSHVGVAPHEGIDLLSDVNVNVRIELGRTEMLVEDVLRLGEGAVVELDKLAGDPVDIFVNDRPVARGEVLVLNDNFCVRVNEILSPAQKGRPTPKGAKQTEESRSG